MDATTVRPVDSVGHYTQVNGLRIHWLEWGPAGARPFILLHGIARSARSFGHLAPRLAARYRVIAPDLRGHGDSDWDSAGAYLVEDYVSDIEALIGRLGLCEAVVWGNSTGGRVAQVLAGTRPDLVAAAIVEDVGPERPGEISERRARRMAREEGGWASVDELVRQLRKDYPRTPEPVLHALARNGSRPRADGRIEWKRDPAIGRGFVPTELWAAVRGIRVPVLYALGGASDIVPAATQAELKRALPSAEIVVLPGLGHYPSDEQPEQFLDLLEGFLARRLPGA